MKTAGHIYKRPLCAPLLTLILLLLSAWTGLAQVPATGVQVVRKEPLAQGMRVTLALAEPEIEPAESEGQRFSRLTLKGAGVDNELGCPALPLVHYTCEIPTGMKVKVKAREQKHREVRVAHPIWPQQPPVAKEPLVGERKKLLQDQASYFGARSAVWQKARNGALQVTTYRKRGQDYVDIMAHPFAYDAQKGLVQYPQELVLDLEFVGPELPKAAGPRTGRIVVLKLKLRGPEDLASLTRGGYNFDRRGKEEVEIYATETEAQALREAGYALEEVGSQSSAAGNSLKAAGVGDGYHTYTTLTAALQQYSLDFSNFCRVSSLGRSVQGRELWAVKITRDPDREQGKPRVRLGSTLHGDEPLGTELCLNLIELLLTGSQTNARISNLVATTEIWVLPLLNPDGFEAFTRFNASGFDLNRSFPDGGGSGLGNPVFGPLPPLAGGPLEVLHMMRFSTERNFTLAANFHTGSLVVNYPYDDDELGSIDSPSPDDALFESIARAYSSHNGPMWTSAFFPQGIVNGAAWYTMDGGMQDWHYRYAGVNEVTIELSDTKRPLPSQLPQFWNENREAMLSFIETVHTGVQGQITDATTGQPVHAALKALGVEHPAFNDPNVGDYHRMLLPGTYHLLFTAPGYETLVYSNLVVQAGQATRLDVVLPRLARPPERILMVTCESLRPGLAMLKARKQAEGFSVQEYVVADGTPAARIRTVLRDVFSIFPAEYILLIGTTDHLPALSESSAGDLSYALMDAGETPANYLGKDAVLGRLWLGTNPAIQEYVQKLAVFAASRTHRSKDLTWISHGYGTGQFQFTQQTHDWCITNFVPSTYRHVRFYETNGSAGELTEHINAGTDGVIYSGHGFPSYWVRFHYDQNALAGLSNFASIPIVFAHTCQSGAFGGVGDAWIQTAARALAYVGSRFDTYWDEDDCLQKAEFEAMHATAQLSLGKALEHALLQVHHLYPERAEAYWKGYRIAGDPTAVLLDGSPLPLAIQTASALPPANLGVAYLGFLSAQGGTAPFTWSLVDGQLPAGLLLSSSGRITGTPRQSGTSQFTLKVQDASEPPQQASLAWTLVVLDFNDTLNAAVDATNLLWNYGGTALWHSQTNVTHDGMDAAESGDIADGQQTWMETTIEGPGIVSFWWKVSSQQYRDSLLFYVNNHWGGYLSGETDWQKQYALLEPGRQTLKWVYAKDDSAAAGQDRAWVDELTFTNSLAPVITTQPTNLTVIIGDSGAFNATAFGAEPLYYQWFFNGTALPAASRGRLELLAVGPAQAGAYTLAVSNACGCVTSVVATLAVVPGLSLAEAMDAPQLAFVNSDAAPWVAQTNETHDGLGAVRSAPLTNWQSAFLQTAIRGPGRLSFWWKVSSSTGTNVLSLLTNQVLATSLAGNSSWQQCTVDLAPRLQTISWYFWRNGGGASEQDLAWLDSIQFAPAPLPPAIIHYPQDLIVPLGGPATLCVGAEGPEPMFYQWYQSDQVVAGATNSCWGITNAQLSHAGQHWVVISNAYGAVTSAPVQVRVIPGSQFLTNMLTVAEAIAIPLCGEANPYPSTLQVTGLAGRIQKLTVTLRNFIHPAPRDVWVLLVSPAGQRTILMRSVGVSYPPMELTTLTFDDEAPVDLAESEEQIISGTYRPTDAYPGIDLPSPAPDEPYSTNLMAFVGSDPNGLWELFVYDDDDGRDRGGDIKGASKLDGWSLQIVTRLPALANLTRQNGLLCLHFPTEVGRQYTVEFKDSLSESRWEPLQTFSGNGTLQSFTNSCASPATRFYRLKIQ